MRWYFRTVACHLHKPIVESKLTLPSLIRHSSLQAKSTIQPKQFIYPPGIQKTPEHGNESQTIDSQFEPPNVSFGCVERSSREIWLNGTHGHYPVQ